MNYIGPEKNEIGDTSYSMIFPNGTQTQEEIIEQILFLLSEILNMAQHLRKEEEDKAKKESTAGTVVDISKQAPRRRTTQNLTPEEVAIQRS